MALPNAILTFIVATYIQQPDPDSFNENGASNASKNDGTPDAARLVIATFTAIMIFILYNRSRTSYDRWWEGGTLLQKTRGEWFNAYSSIIAFTSTKPELQDEVDAYCQLVARLMSLLMCCGLQQVSPCRDRPFEILDLGGVELESVDFLNSAPDKVEVILQWIQRSVILQADNGVLSAAPPILSRAFQEISRGIVNLQNARKIADFPYPYPLAQVCMILQLVHWALTPIASALVLPRGWAVALAFFSIFVLWCIHFNALDLEFPFGTRVNDLPMDAFQREWNKSIVTLLDNRGKRPPMFEYQKWPHSEIDIVMSDASELNVPQVPAPLDKGFAIIKVAEKTEGGNQKFRRKSSGGRSLATRVNSTTRLSTITTTTTTKQHIQIDERHSALTAATSKLEAVQMRKVERKESKEQGKEGEDLDKLIVAKDRGNEKSPPSHKQRTSQPPSSTGNLSTSDVISKGDDTSKKRKVGEEDVGLSDVFLQVDTVSPDYSGPLGRRVLHDVGWQKSSLATSLAMNQVDPDHPMITDKDLSKEKAEPNELMSFSEPSEGLQMDHHHHHMVPDIVYGRPVEGQAAIEEIVGAEWVSELWPTRPALYNEL